MAYTNADMAAAFGVELGLTPEQVEGLEAAFDQWAVGGARLPTWTRLATDISLFNNAAVAMVYDWYGGTATGGPNGDGLYPLMNSDGVVFTVPSPARVAADLTGFEPRGTLADVGDLPVEGAPGDLWIIAGNAWGWNNRLAEWRNLGPFQGPAGPAVEMQTSATHVQYRVVGATNWVNLIPVADLQGEEVSLQKTATHVQWRLGEGSWANLIAVSELVGATPSLSIGTVTTLAPGTSAEVTLRGTAAAPIIDFDLPAGAVGNTGAVPNVTAAITMVANGQPATVTRSGPDTAPVLTFAIPSPLNGEDGREIEIQTNATHAQWRYAGETVWTDWFELALLKVKGDKGDAFEFDAKPADLAGRDDYDAEPEGFTVLVMDTGMVYARVGAVSGVWSDGFPFGQTQNALLVALSELDSSTGVLVQTGAETFAKRAIGAGADAQILDRQSADGRYRKTADAVAMAEVTGLGDALGDKADAAAVLAALGAKADKSDTHTKAEVEGLIDDAIDALPAPPAVPTKATAAELLAGTEDTKFATAKGMADAVAYVVITPAVAATGLNLSTFAKARINLTANLTIGAPSGGPVDKDFRLRIVQDATGGRTVSWHANYILPAGFSIQTTANGVTEVPGVVESGGKVRLFAPSKWVA